VISGAECLEYFAALAQSAAGEHIDLGPAAWATRAAKRSASRRHRRLNYPLQIACWKSAPALAFGNAMIFAGEPDATHGD
jgi:betaine-aldehyde dehydrogenase